MVVMRRKDDNFVRQGGIGAWQHTDHVGTFLPRQRIGQLQGSRQPQWHRAETAIASLGLQGSQIMAGEGNQAGRGSLRDPCRNLQARFVTGLQLELLATPRCLYHLPGVTGRVWGMDDDGPGRPLAGSGFVLVAPAPVVKPRGSGKQRLIPVRVVVQHHQHLAAQVAALEVVPLVLRRLDAIAHENQFGFGQTGAVGLHSADGDEVGTSRQLGAGRTTEEGPLRWRLRLQPDQRYALQPATIYPTRLQAEGLQLGAQEALRELVAGAARGAPLVAITGQFRDHGAHALGGDGLCRCHVRLAKDIGVAYRRGSACSRYRRNGWLQGGVAADQSQQQHRQCRGRGLAEIEQRAGDLVHGTSSGVGCCQSSA